MSFSVNCDFVNVDSSNVFLSSYSLKYFLKKKKKLSSATGVIWGLRL